MWSSSLVMARIMFTKKVRADDDNHEHADGLPGRQPLLSRLLVVPLTESSQLHAVSTVIIPHFTEQLPKVTQHQMRVLGLHLGTLAPRPTL